MQQERTRKNTGDRHEQAKIFNGIMRMRLHPCPIAQRGPLTLEYPLLPQSLRDRQHCKNSTRECLPNHVSSHPAIKGQNPTPDPRPTLRGTPFSLEIVVPLACTRFVVSQSGVVRLATQYRGSLIGFPRTAEGSRVVWAWSRPLPGPTTPIPRLSAPSCEREPFLLRSECMPSSFSQKNVVRVCCCMCCAQVSSGAGRLAI